MDDATPASARRQPQNGVTLVEVLVVLAIVGVMASVVALSINPGARTESALDREAGLLAIRLERAANYAMVQGRPGGFVWDAEGYEFLSFENGEWIPHPDAVLGASHKLTGSLHLDGSASAASKAKRVHVFRPDMLPSATVEAGGPAAWNVVLATGTADRVVLFDGIAAQLRAGPR